jgi:hypothetical protein
MLFYGLFVFFFFSCYVIKSYLKSHSYYKRTGLLFSIDSHTSATGYVKIKEIITNMINKQALPTP